MICFSLLERELGDFTFTRNFCHVEKGQNPFCFGVLVWFGSVFVCVLFFPFPEPLETGLPHAMVVPDRCCLEQS